MVWRGLLVPAALAIGCFGVRSSEGGGQIERARAERPRVKGLDPSDVMVPKGYRVTAVASGLTFPTGIAFDAGAVPHVVEAGYSYGEVFTTPRLLRIGERGELLEVARGEDRRGPWNGLAFHDGAFFVAEGGVLEGGRILRVEPDGRVKVLVQDLPSQGDHHTNGPVVGPDGWIYFGQGTVTNSGVVGEDNHQFGWLARRPRVHDVPCKDVTLAGENFETKNPLTPDPDDRVTTGAFRPFGTASERGEIVRGQVPCSGAILRVRPTGGEVELVAWGFRNPFGLAFHPDGRLFATDNGFDSRGSRQVFGAADALWLVEPGKWYGWPDYAEGRPVADDRYKAPGQPTPRALLAPPPGQPPSPVTYFASHSSSDGLDFSRSERFGHVGQAFVAQFGDQSPVVGKTLHPVGFKVVRVDVATGVISEFASNRGKKNGPASKLGTGGLERPVAVRFDPSGDSLWVVDFGVLRMTDRGSEPVAGTGVLWHISRKGGAR